MPRTDFYELIPELSEWGDLNGHPYHPNDWLCGVGSFEAAIAYSELFWPEFVEYDDCVFYGRDVDPGNYQSWLTQLDGVKDRVEAVLNHVHLEDMFYDKPVTVSQLEFLGERLCDMWLAKVQSDFPGRAFKAEFFRGTEDDYRGYQITLFQCASESK